MSRTDLLRVSRSPLLRYGLAVLASALAMLLTLLLDDPLVEPNTFVLFIAAVVFSSWQGGLGPGLLATCLTTSAIAYLYLPALHLLPVGQSSIFVRMVEFIAVALLVSVLNAARLSAQRRAEAARTEAEAANRAKDVFLAAASHELRTPLASILGWIGMIRSGRLDKESVARALDTIERNAKLQRQLVDNLLDVSRIGAGKVQLNIHPTELRSVIEAAIDVVRPAAHAKGIGIRTELDSSVGLILCDADRLQQVFWNLLANAIKFTPEGGLVNIRCERVQADAQVTVSDTGLGISPDFLPSVFDPFRQSESTRALGGLGLGLAIVRQLVELHGGSVRAVSAGEERGATFIVRLPQQKITSLSEPARRETCSQS
jgi:signal transduction histidine kinase